MKNKAPWGAVGLFVLMILASASLITRAATAANEAVTPPNAEEDAPKQATQNVVYIGGKPLYTKLQQEKMRDDAQFRALPSSLRSKKVHDALKNRQNFPLEESYPSAGNKDAAITVVEMADLSCSKCYATMRAMDERLEADEFEGNIRRVYLHAPENPFNSTNTAAFYGKVAQKNGVFWAFRKAVIQEPSAPDEHKLMRILVENGVDIRTIRQTLIRDTRRLYQELDKEAQVSRRIDEGRVPYYFLNGVQSGILFAHENVPDFLRFEVKQASALTADMPNNGKKPQKR